MRLRVLLLLLLCALPGAARAGQPPAPTAPTAPVAMDFTFRDINPASPTHGQELTLSELYAERGLVLNFLASWCSYCWKELPELQTLQDAGEARVVGVAADEGDIEEPDKLLYLVERAELTLPILYVPHEKLPWMETFYRYELLPATYFIDRGGQVREVLQGKVALETIRGEIEESLGR